MGYAAESPVWWERTQKTAGNMILEPRTDCLVNMGHRLRWERPLQRRGIEGHHAPVRT